MKSFLLKSLAGAFFSLAGIMALPGSATPERVPATVLSEEADAKLISDARKVAVAALLYFLENDKRSVRIQIDPISGALLGDLAVYDVKVTPETESPFDYLYVDGAFSLRHPNAFNQREVFFDDLGTRIDRLLGDALRVSRTAQQYFLETGKKKVEIMIEPDSGKVLGELAEYNILVSPGTTAPSRFLVQDDQFSLRNPQSFGGKTILFNDFGTRVE